MFSYFRYKYSEPKNQNPFQILITGAWMFELTCGPIDYVHWVGVKTYGATRSLRVMVASINHQHDGIKSHLGNESQSKPRRLVF